MTGKDRIIKERLYKKREELWGLKGMKKERYQKKLAKQ
jgi:hypothetical protein